MEKALKCSKNGIFYSDEHFTEETIHWLFQPSVEKIFVSLKDEPVPPMTEAEAFSHAWMEMSKDQEFVDAVQQNNYTTDKGLSDFLASVAAPVTSDIEKRVSETLKMEYEVKIQEDAFVHYVNGEKILVIPTNIDSAAAFSSTADIAIYGVAVVFDVCSMICAIIGIPLTNKVNMLKRLQPTLNHAIAELNEGIAQELKALIQRQQILKVIQKVLVWLRGYVTFKDIIKAFTSSLKWWEIIIACVQFVASVVCIIATEGAALAMKILQLGAAIVILSADIGGLINAILKK